MGIHGQTFHIDQKMRRKIPHLLISMSPQRPKLTQNWKLRRLKLTGNQLNTPTLWVNWGAYAIAKKWRTFKIGFPGNWPKIFIFSESEWFTESFPVFWNKSLAEKCYGDFKPRNSTYRGLQMTFLPMTYGIKFMPIQQMEFKYLILYLKLISPCLTVSSHK